jgi:mannose-6-phosphate isomerase-like protein (cupin superfamily)
VLTKGNTPSFEDAVKTELDAKTLTLKLNNEKVLQYNHAEVFPPEGIDPIYKRSGFIHPLWSPKGNVMTRISPPDHYHHVGIWAPWTKTQFHGHETDFWNLIKGQGTVKFAGFSSFVSGPVYGGFKVKQEHIDFQCKGADQVAINEEWDVRAWNVSIPGKGKVWLLDLATTLNCASDS